MDLIEYLINSPELDECFANCKRKNAYRSNHDKRHVLSCLDLSDKIFKLFKLSERQKLIIKTSLVFHDIGTAAGRFGHAKRSAKFAYKFLKPLGALSDAELAEVYSDILTHDEFRNFKKLEYDTAWFVNLIDKLDFARSRQVENALKRFPYTDFADIDHLEFSLTDGVFVIKIATIGEPRVIDPIKIFNQNVFSKAMRVLKCFCKHFGIECEVFLEKTQLDLKNINKKVMMG